MYCIQFFNMSVSLYIFTHMMSGKARIWVNNELWYCSFFAPKVAKCKKNVVIKMIFFIYSKVTWMWSFFIMSNPVKWYYYFSKSQVGSPEQLLGTVRPYLTRSGLFPPPRPLCVTFRVDYTFFLPIFLQTSPSNFLPISFHFSLSLTFLYFFSSLPHSLVWKP